MSPYGEACYECALSKGDDEDKGVPLVERNQTGSQTQSSAPYHVVPASSGSYGQHLPYGRNQGYGQHQLGQRQIQFGGQAQTYNQQNYGQQNWQAAPPNNGFQFSYTPSGKQRKRRSIGHRMEKFTLQIPTNISSAKPILTLVPVLAELNGTYKYVIVHGNTSLFKVEQRKGVSFLFVKTPFHRKGVFRVWIKGAMREKVTKEMVSKETGSMATHGQETRKSNGNKLGKETGTKKQRHTLGYHEAKRFSLRLTIKAV